MKPKNNDGCGATRSHLERYAAGLFDEAAETNMRDHLASCPACRSAAVEVDPSILFLRLRSRRLPESFWAGFDRELRLRIAEPAFRWTDLLKFPRLAYLTAPVAMLLIVGATLFVMRPGNLGHSRWDSPGTIPSPYAGPETSDRTARTRRDMRRPFKTPGSAGRIESGMPGPPALEEVDSPDARIYRFLVGDEGDEMPIYLVVDESIDI